MVDPRDVVVITRARLQEVVDGAVARGRMTRADAAELLDELITVPRDLARRVAGKLPIAGYDDLTAAEVVRELDALRDVDLRRRGLRAREREPQDGAAAIERKLGEAANAEAAQGGRWRATVGHRSTSRSRPPAASYALRRSGGHHASHQHPPRAGRRARADRRHPRPRRERGRAARGLRRLRRRRAARRPRPGRRRQVQARVRGGPRGRDPGAVAGPDRAARRPSRRAVAGARLREAARGEGRAGRRRPAPDRQARRLRAGPDRARGGAVAVPQQGRVLVRHRPGRGARVRLPRARPLGRDRPDDGLPARVRALQPGREQVLAWAREHGLQAWNRRDQRGLLRNLVVREGRATGELQVRLVTSPGAIDDGRARGGRRVRGAVLDPDRRPRREHAGRRRRRSSPAPSGCASTSATSSS